MDTKRIRQVADAAFSNPATAEIPPDPGTQFFVLRDMGDTAATTPKKVSAFFEYIERWPEVLQLYAVGEVVRQSRPLTHSRCGACTAIQHHRAFTKWTLDHRHLFGWGQT